MKIVINVCYGGFGLSDAAYEKLHEYGIPVVKYDLKNNAHDRKVIYDRTLDEDSKKDRSWMGRYWDTWIRDDEGRTDPLLIRVVEELGSEKASSQYGRLKIVEIPDGTDWEITEYDGNERVEERHNSWS